MVVPLSLAEARTYAAAACFRSGPIGQVGVELEWLVYDVADPARRVPLAELHAALAGLPEVLPGGGAVTIEPGGQVELSSAPAASLAACVDAAGADLAVLRRAVGLAGLRLVGAGLDPDRAPQRLLETPRYAALEEFYDRLGADGRTMMANSASVQVCLDAGDDSDTAAGYRFRWWLADALGPMLMAAFANSPLWFGHRTGWRSTRQAFRFRTDPGRSRAPRQTGDPRAAWARYALDARVVCVRDHESQGWAVPDGLTFRQWLRGGGPRPATLEDLEYHLGTLFPPVRPRGYLELRMIDAQPGDGWIVPLAVVAALFDDPIAAEQAGSLAPRQSVRRHHDWVRAARYGLADPALAEAALGCFRTAQAALARGNAPAAVQAAVAAFTDRYPARGRCPADDAHTGAYPTEHQPT
jgi:glutamate--cysteine ligase